MSKKHKKGKAEQTSANAPKNLNDNKTENLTETQNLVKKEKLNSVNKKSASPVNSINANKNDGGENLTDNEKIVVKIENLSKKYSKKADFAISNVSFCCKEGEILGLLGHNGAGKSTTIKCLEGMLPFENGSISICGFDIKKQPIQAKINMGFVTDNHAVFVKMTGIQYISFMADVYKVPSKVRQTRLAELEKIFNLGDAIYNLISSYSHGMRQKICMMASLIHQPKLWILDEPMTGLDPTTMHAVQNYMKEYASKGNAIIFSSHSLNTVENVCDRVVVIRKGKQIDTLNLNEIKKNNPDFNFEEYFLKNGKN